MPRLSRLHLERAQAAIALWYGGGAVRVSATRVTLDALVYAHNAGHTPERMAADYPSVPLADVYAAIVAALFRLLKSWALSSPPACGFDCRS